MLDKYSATELRSQPEDHTDFKGKFSKRANLQLLTLLSHVSVLMMRWNRKLVTCL